MVVLRKLLALALLLGVIAGPAALIYAQVYRRLNQLFLLAHVHANNVGGLIVYNPQPELKLPQFLEATYLRKDLALRIGPTTETFPTPLDYPIDPRKKELTLDFYPFRWGADG